jgi:hypothetical protein
VRAVVEKIAAVNLGRLHEPADRERAGGPAGLAIERRRGD